MKSKEKNKSAFPITIIPAGTGNDIYMSILKVKDKGNYFLFFQLIIIFIIIFLSLC